MHIQEDLRSEGTGVDLGAQKGIATFLLATLGAACSTNHPTKTIIDIQKPVTHEVVAATPPNILPVVNDPKIEAGLTGADAWLSIFHKAEIANPGGISKLDTHSSFALRTRIDEITGQINSGYAQLNTDQKNSELGRAAQSTYHSLVELRGSIGRGSVMPLVAQTHQNLHDTFELCEVSFTSSLRDCLETSVVARTDTETQQYFNKLLGLNSSEVETPRYVAASRHTSPEQDTHVEKEKASAPDKIAEVRPTKTNEHTAINKEVKWDPFVTKQQAPHSAAEDAATFFGVAGGILAIWKGAQVLWPILFL